MLLLLAVMLVADSTRTRYVHVAPAESLRVVDSGSGAPVILIPGLFGSAFGFRRVIGLLAERGYRPIVIEPLGLGWSGKPRRANYSLSVQADRIASVLDTLDITEALVIGHSIGASIALRTAYRRPQRVSGVLSIDGGPAETATTASFRRAMRFVPWIKMLGGIKLIRKQIRGGLMDASGDRSWVTDEVIAGYTDGAAADLDGTLLAFLAMAQARESERLQPRLSDIHCPVLLLLGGAVHESGPDASQIEKMRIGIASFAVDTVAGAGHYIQEERPEAIVRALERLNHYIARGIPVHLQQSSVAGYSYLPRAHH